MSRWALAVFIWAGAWSCGRSLSGPGGPDRADAVGHTDASKADGRGDKDAVERGAPDAPVAHDANTPDARDGGVDASDARDGSMDTPRADSGVSCMRPTDHTYHVQPTATRVAETGSQACPYRKISGALSAIGAAQENATYLVTISIDGDLDPTTQGLDAFPIEVPPGIDVVGSVSPVPTITVPTGTAGFTYSYPGPTTSPGKDGGHIRNLSLVQAGGPTSGGSGIAIQNTFMGPIGTAQSAFAVQISSVAVRSFDRGIDVETNGNALILDGTLAVANNDGLYVAGGFVTVTPSAALPVHFDGNLAFGVHVEGASGVFLQGMHTATGGRSITVNDNVAGGVSLFSSLNLWQYLFTLELRGNPTGARLYLGQAVSIIDSIIANNGIGIELLPSVASSISNSGWTNLGNDTGTNENELSGNAPDLCVAGPYVPGLSIYAANNIWDGAKDCLNASSAEMLTVDETGCETATNLGFTNYSSEFTDTVLNVGGCSW